MAQRYHGTRVSDSLPGEVQFTTNGQFLSDNYGGKCELKNRGK